MPRPPNSPPALRRHRAQCQICRRADRKEIDRQFLDWTSPREIAANCHLGSIRVVYRHAHALGLFQARRETLRLALDRLIEHVAEVTPSAAIVLSAIRLAHQMDEKQQASANGNGGFGTGPFRISFEGLPRSDAISGRPSKTEAPAPNAPEPKPTPAPSPAPVDTPPPTKPARRRATTTPNPAPERNKQPTVSGFARPWSKRRKPFPSPALAWSLQPPGP